MSNTKTNPNDLVSAYGYCNEQDHFDSNGGLTKREHFAAMVMQAICTHHDTWGKDSFEKIAIASVEMADALIEQLNKQTEQ